MKIEIEINTENSAFENPCETQRILKNLVNNRIDYDSKEYEEIRLTDINGNTIGFASINNGVTK